MKKCETKTRLHCFGSIKKKQPEHEGESENSIKYDVNDIPYSVITRPPYCEELRLEASFGLPERRKRRS
jgi:hypothetical protein